MRYHIVTAIIGATALIGGLLIPQPERVPTWACVEDMPCWDWKTMGNGCHGIDDYGTIECYRDGGYYIMEAM